MFHIMTTQHTHQTDSYLFTSESVSEGHPDKIADQISDAILDAYLAQDPQAKVAVECLITTGRLIIAGEITSHATVNAEQLGRDVIRNIGYHDEAIGFNCDTAIVENLLHTQSPEINSSVLDGGAGDQGIMFGYASDETPELMPMPIIIAHKLMERQSMLRKNGILPWLLPDAKSQVTIRYEQHKPVEIETIVISTQHKAEMTQQDIREQVISYIIEPVLSQYLPHSRPEYLINPSGSFTIGGPHGDTGLTGRKIIVDTYGGSCPHGGGAFSGKDASKVDRSAAYAARFVAKHIVAAGLAHRCTVQLSYAIGKTEPTSLYVNTYDSGTISDAAITTLIPKVFDLTPNAISTLLELRKPIYLQTAAYGHFGKSQLSWEVIHPTFIEQLQTLSAHHLS
jgi:S-adenosylmethionine synthetase